MQNRIGTWTVTLRMDFKYIFNGDETGRKKFREKKIRVDQKRSVKVKN